MNIEKKIKNGVVSEICTGNCFPVWIKVEDELPPMLDEESSESDMVLIYNKGWGFGIYLLKNKYGPARWIDRDGEVIKVTHWLPLPDAPKD